MPLMCAQLSDLHLDGTEPTRNRLRRIADELAAYPQPVDVILVTGDIVECSAFDGDREAALAEYRRIHEVLSPLAPVGYCPGNSDAEPFDRFLDELGSATTGPNSRLVVEGVTFLLASSRVPGSYHGHLDEPTLAWLDAALARTPTPLIIVMHHPPIPFGHPVIDTLRLDNPEPLAALITRAPQVIGLLCGHTHAAAAAVFAGRLLVVAPGVHSYGQLPWAYTEGSRALIDPMTPPGYALHRIDEAGIASFPVLLDRATIDRAAEPITGKEHRA